MWWLIRSVRGSRWRLASSQGISSEIVEKAAADLIPRDQDNGGVSVYEITDETEERFAGSLHVALVRKPETVHFLRIKPQHIKGLPLTVKHEFARQQHPYLQRLHRNIYGIDRNTGEALAKQILTTSPSLLTITSGQIKQFGRQLLSDPQFAKHIAFPEAY